MKLFRKAVSGIVLTLVFIGILASAFEVQLVRASGTIYIRADGSVDPPTAPIHRDGDTYIFTDNIYDSIVVERNNIVIDGNGYTLQGTGSGVGIYLSIITNVTVQNTQIKNFYYGIMLHSSSNSIISGNNITANKYAGILLEYSSNNGIIGNIFFKEGLYVYDSYGNIVVDNLVNDKPLVYLEGVSDYTIEDAGQVVLVNCNNIIVENLNLSHTTLGVELWGTNNTRISGNTVTANKQNGIELLHHSCNNSISGNNITANNYDGIVLYYSSYYNSISRNNITNNDHGIGLASSYYNSISGNNITNNDRGIWLFSSSNNIIYHNNFIDNAEQVYFYEAGYANAWDDGYPSGGNYWSDYAGVDLKSSPNQDLPGSDGIGDTPYIIDADNQDRYPLMNPWGAGTPLASFTLTPSTPKVGEPVTFDASSSTPNGGTIVKYEWNFGDGNKATGKIVTHAYANPETYMVKLNVTDSEGLWDIEQKQIQVVQPHGPKAEFTATPETANVGETVTFDASASKLGWNGTHTMPITEYRWDFGDGNKTTTSTPIVYHGYKTSGNYYVTLTVYAPSATPETDTTTHKVTAVSIPVGGYSIPIKVHTKTEPIIPYITLITMLTAIFVNVKRKTKRKR